MVTSDFDTNSGTLWDEATTQNDRNIEKTQALKPNCSFSAKTLILTDKGFKPISQIQIGDKVLSYDETTKTTGYFPVEQVWKHNDPIIESLKINGETITTTPEHPFFTLERGWVATGRLWHGAHVREADGSYGAVDSFSFVTRWQAMYNLTVSKAHTFFVGREEWLVHNDCPADVVGNTPIRPSQGSVEEKLVKKYAEAMKKAVCQMLCKVAEPSRQRVSFTS